MTYGVRGRQYVAIPVGSIGGAAWFGATPLKLTPELKRPAVGNSIMVFALPEEE